MKPGYFLPLLLATLFFAVSASALRCGTHLVGKGDSRFKVQKICGDPDDVQVSTIYRSGIPSLKYRQFNRFNHSTRYKSVTDDELLIHQRSLVEVQVEEWVYNFGPNRIVRQIRFENGRVVKIDGLGYGYTEEN